VRHAFGAFRKDIARGLLLRCDWGPQYIAQAWISEVKWLDGCPGNRGRYNYVVPQPGSLNAIAATVALVVFVATHRLEHHLARQAAYRVPRHLVRLGVFSLAVYAQLLRYQGHLLVAPIHLHVSRLLHNPTPVVVPIVGTVAVACLRLWTDNSTWRRWHRLLEALRLRQRPA